MRVKVAYSFKSEMSLNEIRQHLNTQGPWQWMERESFWEGDYISTLAKRDYAMLKIYDLEEPSFIVNSEDADFIIDIEFESSGPGAESEFKALHAKIIDEVLPSLGAREVRRTESVD